MEEIEGGMKTKFEGYVKGRKAPFSVIPANPGSGPGQAPESRITKNFWTPTTLPRRKPGAGVTA